MSDSPRAGHKSVSPAPSFSFPCCLFFFSHTSFPLEQILCSVTFGSVDGEESRTRSLRCVLDEFWFQIFCLLN